MIPGALAALPVVGDVLRIAGPLLQPFANVGARSLGNIVDKTVNKIFNEGTAGNSRHIDFSRATNINPNNVKW